MKYRADIDGLRAIAVLSVVIFHLGIAGFGGGYVGVDVFFVISGFLITSIIQTKLDKSSFSFTDFYLRRIRRLIPPLVATVAVTVVFAGAILTPYDMINFGRSAVAALFSLSNIAFYLEAGYWDTASELKPLLHTWSLGVEEQFYLFWPALIVLLAGIRRKIPFGVSMTVISLAGFVLCVWYTNINQSAAFYLLPFRIFEFSLGALAISMSRLGVLSFIAKRTECLYILGLALILGSVVLFDENTVFPGWAVLFPALGSMFLLLAGSWPQNRGYISRYILQNPISLWVGRVSYSMYLVHWPIIALYRYVFGLELKVLDQILLAAATLAATLILHYGVERRFYQRASTSGSSKLKSISGAAFARRILTISCLVAILPLSAWLGDGWSWRSPDQAFTPQEIKAGQKDRFQLSAKGCKVFEFDKRKVCDTQRETQILVLGNSHEPDGYNFLTAIYGKNPDVNLILFGQINGCDNLEFSQDLPTSTSDECTQRLDTLFSDKFVSNIDVVFYAANRPFAMNKYPLYAIMMRLKQLNPSVRIVTLGGYINTRKRCSQLINENRSSDACARPEHISYFESEPEKQPLYAEISDLTDIYIDRVRLLCKNRVLQTCLTRAPEGVPMFWDEHHNSFEFIQMTGELFASRNPELVMAIIN
jgi:peptidoglycan/LPS O-acetylase OafA/YrhL